MSSLNGNRPDVPLARLSTRPQLWRSLDEHARAATAGGPEFPPGASQPPEPSRRDFLQLLGASAALAGLAGCVREPPEKVLPYTKKPEEVTPGNPLHYATAFSLGGFATGLVVTSYEGRPTKIEGNPDHPSSRGAAGVYEQAMLLSLYDPARARAIRHRGAGRSWRALLEWIAGAVAQHRKDGGAGLRFLCEPDASPLLADLRARILAALPAARFFAYAPLADDSVYEGARLAFGRPLSTRVDFARAQVVVSLEADFLGSGPDRLSAARDFASLRVPDGELSRLYVVESTPSLTGALADHRLRMRSSEVARFALGLALELVPQLEGGPRPLLADAEKLRTIAHDLAANPGRSAVVVGPRQPPIVHALAHTINAALGNVDKTVAYAAPVVSDVAAGPGALSPLVAEMQAGQIDTLVITAANPVYTAPADLDLGGALAKVPHAIYHNLYEDETAAKCAWFVPATHPLESWGDARASDGTLSVVQPLITPLFAGVTAAELWAAFVGEGDRGAYTLVRDRWRKQPGAPDFEAFWEETLHDGVVRGSATRSEPTTPRWTTIAAAAASLRALPAQPAGGIELNFLPDAKIYDGRFANNAWLQELPDPITKLTWDNALLLSPTSAGRLGLETGDVVAVTLRDRSLRAPVLVLPGHADDAAALTLGYGRTGLGEELAQGVGANAYLVRPSDAPWFAAGAALRKTGRRHRFAITQEHATMEGRPLAHAATLSDFRSHPEQYEEQRAPLPSLYDPVRYPSYQWAMSIDLARCIGCSACVVACQAENNIPVVGKTRVARAREMHWLRIDRYFTGGSVVDPGIVFQPVACQHCENAPCEYVCPVNATTHSDEGLNEMVYNRCVGTRYCSNNCPYKVRRFNFFDYVGVKTQSERMLANPEVSIRSRGVMEKCTYCVQRIERARIEARVAGREIRDGEIQTACQQTCPTRAITFGSLHDPRSQVSRLHADERRYDLLHELGTRPRTAYLVRLTNPNPGLR